jgi:hypothetical protein
MGSYGSGSGQLNWPYGVLIDSQGRIVVSDGDTSASMTPLLVFPSLAVLFSKFENM